MSANLPSLVTAAKSQSDSNKTERTCRDFFLVTSTPVWLQLLWWRLNWFLCSPQLVHGGATWNNSVNRNQVRDGAAVLGTLLPVFIDIMMDNPRRDWGKPFYPVVK